MQVVWEYGPSTVRFVNDKLNEQRDVNYTATLKLMQIMADKGSLKRDERQMTHGCSYPCDYCIINEHFRILRFTLLIEFQYFAISASYLTFHTDNYLNDGKK